MMAAVNILGCISKLLTISCKSITFNSSYRMDDVTDICFVPLKDSNYLKPLRMTYKQNGKEKFWDIMEIHDSVSIIIYNISRKVFVFVKQFRPGVYFACIPKEVRNQIIDMNKYPPGLGMTIELCAGIVDKDKSLPEIAKEEVLEECGYDVPVDKFERLHSFCASVGIGGAVMTMFYCEVTDDMKVAPGGGIGDEMIEIIEMNLEECERYTSKSRVISPGSVLISYYWFTYNKPQYCSTLRNKK